MQTGQCSAVYQQLVDISQSYLGPSADSFVAKQVESHLHKSPKEFDCNDVGELIDWMSVAASLMVEDESKISNYIGELHKLALSNP